MSFSNPSAAEIKAFLQRARTIAVVGLSSDPDRPSYSVSMYMQSMGYRIVPVRPGGGFVLGEKVYESLRAIPHPIDVVNLFRRSEFISKHVEEALAIQAPALWTQEGVVDDEACARARDAGLFVVQDRCLLKEHRRAGLPPRAP